MKLTKFKKSKIHTIINKNILINVIYIKYKKKPEKLIINDKIKKLIEKISIILIFNI